jgi:ATP-dependent helicase HrpB
VDRSLPVYEVIPQLLNAFESHSIVILKAPPGAGKSTAVPLELLNASWNKTGRNILLEPRRLAAQAVAQRMATQLQETVGQTIGIRMRFQTKVSHATRLEIITDGVMTRIIRQDPELKGINLVIFDEFHERSLSADLSLALCLDLKRLFHADLKLLIMSATLDEQRLLPLLGDIPVIESKGRTYPVAVYHARTNPITLIPALVSTIIRALTTAPGDMLVFCPGVGEILALQRQLNEHVPTEAALKDCDILALYGDLPIEQQAHVLQPAAYGKRRLILSTNVAETSVTIDGVQIVVDSGLARRNRFDPTVGFSRLQLEPVARSSLEQRKGRAGRTATGLCFRVFTEADERQRLPFTPPEIQDADCASLVLEVLDWGTPVDELSWIDKPPPGAWSQALTLLTQLNAVHHGRLTSLGSRMTQVGAHPRLARMLLCAEADQLQLASEIAALLGERDVYNRRDVPDCGIDTRLDCLREPKPSGLVRRILESAKHLFKLAQTSSTKPTFTHTQITHLTAGHAVGQLLLLAYPDRIAQRRSAQRYQLRSGQSVSFTHPDRLTQSEYLVIPRAQGSAQDSRILLAASVSLDDIESIYADQITTIDEVCIDPKSQSVVRLKQKRLDALILSETIIRDVTDEQAIPVLITEMTAKGLTPWNNEPKASALLERIRFLARTIGTEFQDITQWSDDVLLQSLTEWAAPFALGARKIDHVLKLDWTLALEYRLGSTALRQLQRWAPVAITVPSGSSITIQYGMDPPRLSVRLQEIFGLTQSPTVANNQVALAVELLSPARRPVQVTQDLVSFWKNGYHEVRKELKGRYPKHYWPDDPHQAEPTARAKPRK